jgi:hypothetical protein
MARVEMPENEVMNVLKHNSICTRLVQYSRRFAQMGEKWYKSIVAFATYIVQFYACRRKFHGR